MDGTDSDTSIAAAKRKIDASPQGRPRSCSPMGSPWLSYPT